MKEAFWAAIQHVLLDPKIWGVVLASAVYGVFMGAIPGLTATMAVALVVPLTFFMDPISSVAAVVTMVACAIFAGDIPNALLRIPGTPASAAYADDAYALTRRGMANQALGTCLIFSVAGGLFGALVLMLAAPPLAEFASKFSVVEYFWLYLLGLTCAVIVSRGSPVAAAFALAIGLFLSTIGLSAVHTKARFTFDQPELYQGINFIPAMIGLFGVSEILRNILTLDKPDPVIAAAAAGRGPVKAWGFRFFFQPLAGILSGSSALLWKRKWHGVRSGFIGSFVGMLPGAGADIGSWVSMAVSKRFSKKPDEYGRGSLDGIGDASISKSSSLAGAWVPALVFGIPGDSVTAIVIGVLLMKNVKPGPEIFQQQAELVYSIYLIFVLANLLLIPIGLAAIKAGGYLLRVPRRILLPVILFFCVLGSYAINGSYFDVLVMGAMGLLGFFLERRRIPLAPVVLGIILGGPLEERLIQSLTASEGSIGGLFGRPIAAVLGVVTLGLWLMPLVMNFRKRRVERP